ncbi:hypothetical protein RND81_06G038300 [Saponaria officinalis]|uniref:Uncharacterized protein n=1 Tax=Saponaria officinalis TaxID=3572 RepID=A0AAW1K6X3_SAPOF
MAATLSTLKLQLIPLSTLQIPSQKSQLLTNSILPTNNNNNNNNHISQHKLGLNHPFNPFKISPLSLTTLTFPFFFDAQDALAAGGEFGLLEGRSMALIHPIVMGGLFLYTLWAGYLGWQWRRVRTIQNEINELKKQVKPVAVTPDGAASVDAPLSPVEAQIQQLTEERKLLVKGNFRDRHFNAGSILLGFGVFEAIGGGVNTWLRTGKLFPGPHLFAGAAITVLWAAAAALVPAMQKGNETARNLHIALNALNVALFIWQIPTGFDIVLKVFEFTKWP